MNQKLQGQIRHILGALLAYAYGKGWLDEAIGNDLLELLPLAIPMIWSWFSKKPAEQPKETQ